MLKKSLTFLSLNRIFVTIFAEKKESDYGTDLEMVRTEG